MRRTAIVAFVLGTLVIAGGFFLLPHIIDGKANSETLGESLSDSHATLKRPMGAKLVDDAGNGKSPASRPAHISPSSSLIHSPEQGLSRSNEEVLEDYIRGPLATLQGVRVAELHQLILSERRDAWAPQVEAIVRKYAFDFNAKYGGGLDLSLVLCGETLCEVRIVAQGSALGEPLKAFKTWLNLKPFPFSDLSSDTFRLPPSDGRIVYVAIILR